MNRRPGLTEGAAALVLGALAVGGLAARPATGGDAPPKRPEHVVLVVLSGGVRAKEMLDPSLMPSVAAIAGRGVVVDRIAVAARSAYAATVSLLVGRADVRDEPAKPRPDHPTLLECARRFLPLAAERAWFVSPEGGDDLRMAASERTDYGTAVAPAVAYGAGAFGEPLGDLLEVWGHPVPTEEPSWALLRSLRVKNRSAVETWLPAEVDAGTPESERVERALLAELDRRSLLAGGAAPEDERAARIAATVLRVHRPALCVLRLVGASRGQASFEAYRAALRADDAAIGGLRTLVGSDPAFATTTAFLVVADMGRNAAVGADGRLSADDATAERLEVAFVGEGPGLRRGTKPKGARSVADVAPTIGRLLGFPTPEATGAPWTGVLEAGLGGN